MTDTPDRPEGTPASPTYLHEPGRPEASRRQEGPGSGIWMRGLQMLLVSMLIGVAQTVLQVVTLVQFVLMLVDKGRPNAQIAGFGKGLGDWFAKAARFQAGQSEVKPWPWTPWE